MRLLLLAMLLALPVFAQEHEGRRLVEATLFADRAAVVPGEPLRLGVLLEMAEGWHTYWENPGDAGLPTRIDWKLPEGFAAGPLAWPIPRRIIEPGDIEVYAYKGRVLLVSTITTPDAIAAESVTLSADVSWLVCEEICIPGSASLSIELPVMLAAERRHSALFDEFAGLLPDRAPQPYGLAWSFDGNASTLRIEGLPEGARADFFPLPAPGREIGHPSAEGPVIRIPSAPPVRGILVVEQDGDRKGWTVSGEPPSAAAAPSPHPSQPGLWTALFYGFLGGLILNLMPCVLPVISLKIFGFMRLAGGQPAEIFRHGLAFCGGIAAWFGGLAAVVIGLKAAGTQVTWAFQFQNPWFNLAISAVVFVFALNLMGVFEIALPGRAASALDRAGEAEGLWGSFFQGVFATLLATPCTAPFLGAALGFAFSQPAPVIAAMFAAVALGMASPYLILSARPGWLKYLPKPGAWMERVKQFMAFPLLATLLWLLLILGNQKGLEAVIWAGAFFLCLALAAWIYGAFCGLLAPARGRAAWLALAVAIVLGGGWFFVGNLFAASARGEGTKAESSG